MPFEQAQCVFDHLHSLHEVGYIRKMAADCRELGFVELLLHCDIGYDSKRGWYEILHCSESITSTFTLRELY